MESGLLPYQQVDYDEKASSVSSDHDDDSELLFDDAVEQL
jgi:hypothetical protein